MSHDRPADDAQQPNCSEEEELRRFYQEHPERLKSLFPGRNFIRFDDDDHDHPGEDEQEVGN